MQAAPALLLKQPLDHLVSPVFSRPWATAKDDGCTRSADPRTGLHFRTRGQGRDQGEKTTAAMRLAAPGWPSWTASLHCIVAEAL